MQDIEVKWYIKIKKITKSQASNSLFFLLKLFIKLMLKKKIPASSSSRNPFVSGAGGLTFKSRADQIGNSVASGWPRLQHFFERSCVAQVQYSEMAPPTRNTLRRNIASIIKNLVLKK